MKAPDLATVDHLYNRTHPCRGSFAGFVLACLACNQLRGHMDNCRGALTPRELKTAHKMCSAMGEVSHEVVQSIKPFMPAAAAGLWENFDQQALC